MSEKHKVSRREFISTAAKTSAIAVAVPTLAPRSALAAPGKPGANDRIQLGLIGAGGMGSANLSNCAKYPDVVVTGICDVWKSRRDAVAATYKGAKKYHDYREMLQQKDVDAVIIATPQHWHCLNAVDAAEAGKDIYLQKPMTLNVAESLAVKRAVEKQNCICQIGTQIHAGENYRRVVEIVQSGNLGKISVARTFLRLNHGPDGIGQPPVCDPPEELDLDFWVGPAPMNPFREAIIGNGPGGSWKKMSFTDYRGGWTPGMAPHILDLPHWALDPGFPTVTSVSGGRYVHRDVGDAPDTVEVLWQHPNLTITWMMSLVSNFAFDFLGRQDDDGAKWIDSKAPRNSQRWLGIYFHGVNGTLFSDYEQHSIVPDVDRMLGTKTPESSIPPSPGHEREWLDCLHNRKQPSCNPSYHYKIDVAIGLAKLSLELGRSIQFDPATEQIVGDAEAAKLAKPEYRDPWKFPEKYL